jgi:flagellar hook-associated protein 1 FlgK
VKPGETTGVSIGSLDGYATSIRFDIANTLSFAKKTLDTSVTLTLAAENQRLAVSGVSLDEEMVNLVKYQHAYNGAARVITVMDEMLDKLINGTGRVGL